MAHTVIQADAGLRVLGQPGLYKETLSQTNQNITQQIILNSIQIVV